MNHIDLFSGIGGFAYAARQVWPDYRNLFFCEINPFCKAVLKKNFGNDILIFDDIKTITVEEVWKRYAQDVKPENLLEKTGGVENVNPNTELNITTTTERHGSNIQTKEDGSKECRLSKPMVESASVVEKRSQNFSPLITNMVEETKSDRRLDVDTPFTLKSLGVDSQKDSNYFATTAITQKDSMGNAHTKNREVTVERVIADTTSKRPIQCEHEERPRYQERIFEGHQRVIKVDLLTGGFPCQPFSTAGKRNGRDDERHLWPEMFRVIKAFRPLWVIGENVRGLVNIENGMALQQVFLDLESIGYSVQAFIIPACAVNAPHRRDRIWIVAHSTLDDAGGAAGEFCETERRQNGILHRKPCRADRHAADGQDERLEGWWRAERWDKQDRIGRDEVGAEPGRQGWQQPWLEVATRLCVLDARLPDWMDGYFDQVIMKDDYAKTSKKNRTKGLRILREGISSKEIWGELGRLFQVDKEEVLLSLLRRVESGANRQNNPQLSGQEDKRESGLRDLWRNASYRHSPYRRQHQKQFAKELGSILPQLPHEIALEVATIWDYLQCAFSAMTGPAVILDGLKLSKSKHREERLKALGNAIVPQVAIEIMRAIKECE